MKENLPALFIPVALIMLGTMSPSNGVDDAYTKSGIELLTTAFILVLAAVIILLLIIKPRTKANNSQTEIDILQKFSD